MSEKYYKVSHEELYSLLTNQAILECLEASGVDNWEGYGDWHWPDVDASVMGVLDDLPQIEEEG